MKQHLLFVCLGNICRSPAAEGIMRSLVESRGLSDDFLIDSAGIGSWHVGQLPDIRMRRCGQQYGYTFDSRARQLQPEDFDRFDFIIVMDDENLSDARRVARTEKGRSKLRSMAHYLRSHPGQLTIPDPYYGSERDFHLVIELLEDACESLLDSLIIDAGRPTRSSF